MPTSGEHEPPAGRPARELRVHGVSGTSPQDLLDRPLVEQVAGDRIAGFYRPRLLDESRDDAPNVVSPVRPGAPTLEGYNWGGLTSGSPGRALWLPLLPFTLVNIAPRARPPGEKNGTTAATWYLCRLLALLLTILFVLSAVGVGEDLVGWQCAGNADRCVAAQPRWLFRMITDHSLPAGQTLLLGLVVPLVSLALLWLVSARSANRYERTVADLRNYRNPTDATESGDTNALELGLSSELMWRGEWQVRRLRALHLQAGFATILWTLIAPTAPRWLAVVPAAVLVYAAVALALPSYTGRGRSRRWLVVSRGVGAVLTALGVIEVVGLAVDGGWLDPRYLGAPEHGSLPVDALPFFGVTVLIEFAIAVGVLLLLVVCVAIAAARTRRPAPQPGRPQPGRHEPLRPALAGMTSAVFAGIGVFLAASFTSGVYLYSATWLRTGSMRPGFGDVSRVNVYFVVPDAVRSASEAFAWAAIVFAVLVLVGIGLVTVSALRGFRPGRLVPAEALVRDYGAQTVARDPARARTIRRDIFLARLVDLAPIPIGLLTVAGLVITVRFGVQALTADDRDALAAATYNPAHFYSLGALRADGAYLAVLLLIGLVALGALAFRVPATRRAVGILWDIASFWPRSCHPLAPPCYAERTVPDLVTRISAHRVGQPDAGLVLSAHSQGTVIGAATLFQLDTFDRYPDAQRTSAVDVLPGVGLLTFGCVLRRLYGRYFPAYFGPDRLAALQRLLTSEAARGPRWRNLWRYTDYLGGQVTAGPPPVVPDSVAAPIDPERLLASPPVTGPKPWEWHSPDPALFERPAGDTTFLVTQRHSDFWRDPSGCFQLAVAELSDQVVGNLE